MTCGDAGFAARTFFEIYFESVLLTWLWLSNRNEASVGPVAGKLAPQVVPVGELIDGCPVAFLSEQSVDKGARAILLFDWRRKHCHLIDRLKCEGKLSVTKVSVAGAKTRRSPSLLNVFAGEEMAVANFELEAAGNGQAGDCRNFGAEKIA